MLRIDVRNLGLSIGGTRILDDVSLSLESGELVALLGPSGSGKSSLLKAMTGTLPAVGRVELCGRALFQELEEMQRLIGYVPQDDVLHRTISVEKVLRYSAMLRLESLDDARIDAEVERVLNAVDLAARRDVRVKSLSGGQRKRVSIAMELLAEPPLMFLDEPTSGLDPALEEQMMDLFRALTGPDRITVVTTHVMASLDRVDLAVVLAKGRVVYVGPPADLTAFFDVDDLADVYRRLSKEGPSRWVNRFGASAAYRTYVAARLRAPPPPMPGRAPQGA